MKINSSIFWIAVALVSLVLAGCQAQPADVAKKAANIASFTLPEGYQPEMALELGGYTLVSYHPGDGHSHLYLVQAPASQEISSEKLNEMLGQSQSGKKDRTTRLTVVEKRTATIRGKTATLVISDGTNGDGEAYRQVTTAFQGRGGVALLVLEEPVSHWSDARMDRLVASIQ